MTVRVRYPPSPTGVPHIGNIRTALFNWLLARHADGAFVLRIEDTDQARLVPGATEKIIQSLRWLGLDYDEGPDPNDPSRDIGDFGPYVQSRRLSIYREAVIDLIERGHAYRCYCTPEQLERDRIELRANRQPPRYKRRCRELPLAVREDNERQGLPSVVRFAMPPYGETTFRDAIRGEITFQNETQDDFIALKSDGYPTYHLANVVDDHEMRITHVLRGDEWVSSTPKHVQLYRAFHWQPPVFAHLPLILGPDRAKLSKRHGDASILDFRRKGYLPDPLCNYLALLGWSLDDKTEILPRDLLINAFTLERVVSNPAIFDVKKLDWLNGLYIRRLGPEEFARQLHVFLLEFTELRPDFGFLVRVSPLIQERVKVLSDATELIDFFLQNGELKYDVKTLLSRRYADDPAAAGAALEDVLARLQTLDAWEQEDLEGAIRPLAEELGVKTGDLFGVLRVAVTGKTATPPLFETMELLGQQRTLERLRRARERLRGQAPPAK